MSKEITKSPELKDIQVDLPDGLGRLIPVGSHIKILLGLLESDNFSRLSVLNDVLEHCGIEPDDLVKYRNNGKKHMNGNWNEDEKYSWQS